MNRQVFETSLQRLQNEWKHSFGEEKKKLIWARLKNMDDEFMESATDEFIANRRSAPVLQDFYEYEHLYNKRKSESRYSAPKSVADILGGMFNPKEYNDASVRARIKARIELVGRLHSNKISKKQFVAELEKLDLAMNQKQICDCDNGVLIKIDKEGHRFAFACYCEKGRAQNRLPEFEPILYEGKYVQ